MKKVKKSYVFIGVLSILCVVMWVLIKIVSINIPTEMEKYIKNKYGADCSFVKYVDEEGNANSKTVLLKDSSGFSFKVSRFYYTDNTIGYMDTYLAGKYQKNIEALLNSAIPEGVRDTSKIKLDLNKSSFGECDGLVSFNDFIKNSVIFISIDSLGWDINTCQDFCNNLNKKTRVSAYVYNLKGEKIHFILNSDYEMIVKSS